MTELSYVVEDALSHLRRDVGALGSGLQNAAPASNAPTNSLKYLNAVGAVLDAALQELHPTPDQLTQRPKP